MQGTHSCAAFQPWLLSPASRSALAHTPIIISKPASKPPRPVRVGHMEHLRGTRHEGNDAGPIGSAGQGLQRSAAGCQQEKRRNREAGRSGLLPWRPYPCFAASLACPVLPGRLATKGSSNVPAHPADQTRQGARVKAATRLAVLRAARCISPARDPHPPMPRTCSSEAVCASESGKSGLTALSETDHGHEAVRTDAHATSRSVEKAVH